MCRAFFLNENTLQKLKNQVQFEALSHGDFIPGAKCVVLTEEGMCLKKWGYDFEWASESIYNIWIENLVDHRLTKKEKKLFLKSYHDYQKRRCVILANGFYEHKNTDRYRFIPKGNHPLVYLAGVYNEKDEFTIVTQPPTLQTKDIHHRLPVLISESMLDDYLKLGKELVQRQDLEYVIEKGV